MNDNLDIPPDAINDAIKPKWGFRRKLSTVTVVLGIGLLLAGFMLPATRRVRPAAYRLQCKNNLKQIGLALHNYVDTYHALPPAFTIDADGKPLHSWRTLILPFLDEHELYKSIDLSKAWNDPANAEAFKRRVSIYQCPSTQLPDTETCYMALVGTHACLRPTQPRKFSEITDGLGSTLMLLEVPPDRAVPWMSPVDADEKLFEALGPDTKTAHSGGSHVLFANGSTRFIPSGMPADQRRALITVDGNETIGEF